MMEIAHGITIDPAVRFGKPVIKGTRVPVDLIMGKIAGGMTMAKVAKEYDLDEKDILAALGYNEGACFMAINVLYCLHY